MTDPTTTTNTTTTAVEEPALLGRKVQISTEHAGPSTSTLASSSTASIPSSNAQANRVRALSVASTSASSVASSGVVTPKRRAEFVKHFSGQLDSELDDVYDVRATQSGDLQSSVLIHGRLYLTPYHLCFRSNILGIVTKKIHPLKSVVGLEKGTTAKWIQNAIYVYVEGQDKYFGYGSLGDRDAMYDDVLEAWKNIAPDRVKEAEEAGRLGMSTGKEPVKVDDSSSTSPDDSSTDESDDEEETNDTTDSPKHHKPKHTKCSGDHYKERVGDTVFPIPMETIFELVYRNKEFSERFYVEAQKLKDFTITDWKQGDQGEERRLEYIMSINNPIGPNESECWGKETIVASDSSKAYEILSETHTPGLPAGNSFAVKTRTCLTHTSKNGKPATRLHATSLCDWSSFSMLKSTITPAVIKGQEEYYVKLGSTIRDWIRDHPEDFGDHGDNLEHHEGDVAEDTADETINDEKGAPRKINDGAIEGGDPNFATATVSQDKSLVDHTFDIPSNPVAASMALLCAMFILREVYWWLY